jgi:hypothetical protein
MALAEIRLLTDAADPEHQHLNDALAAALAHLQHDDLRDGELTASVEDVIALGRTIIRHEWGRVKRGCERATPMSVAPRPQHPCEG